MKNKIKLLNQLINTQFDCLGNSEYMCGMYNGMQVSKSVITGKRPNYVSVKKTKIRHKCGK